MFGVAGSDTAPPLAVQQGVLDQVAQLVESLIIFTPFFAVLLGRHNRFHALCEGFLKDGMAVIPRIRQQHCRCEAV